MMGKIVPAPTQEESEASIRRLVQSLLYRKLLLIVCCDQLSFRAKREI